MLSCSTKQISLAGLDRIERLDEVANFLTLVSNEEKELVDTCGLKPTEALEMLQPLHAHIDEESQKAKYLIISKHLNTCEENCHCGLYSDLARNKQLKNDLYKKAQNFPQKSLIRCAQKTAVWFCHDKLLNSLKSELSSTSTDGL